MASIEELKRALIQADQAGDTSAAELFARKIKEQQGSGIDVSATGEAQFPKAPFPEMDQPAEPTTLQQAGFGPTPKGMKALGDVSLLNKLMLIQNALGSNMASGFTYGAGPALEKRFGSGEFDKSVEQGTEVLGPWGASAAQTAGSIASPLSALLPFTRAVGEYAPGFLAALKRIGASTADTALVTSGNAAIRGEEPFVAPTVDTLTHGLPWAAAFEAALGLKGAAGNKFAGVNREVKAKDTAYKQVEGMRGAPSSVQGRGDTVLDELGLPAVAAVKGLSGTAPVGYEKIHVAAGQRLAEAADRAREVTTSLAGRPLADPSMQLKQHSAVAHDYKDYLPALEQERNVPNASIWLNKRPGQKKARRVTVPREFAEVLQDPDIYDAWATAYAAGAERAKSYATKDNRQPPGRLENQFHAIDILKKSDDPTLKNYGETLSTIMKGNHQDVAQALDASHQSHARGRGVELGTSLWKHPDQLNISDAAREMRTSPDMQQATQEGYLGEFQRQVAEGKPPRITESTVKTANAVLGQDRAAKMLQFLEQERQRQAMDIPLSKFEGTLQGAEKSKDIGPTRRAASAGLRMIAGAIGGGGLPGVAWAAPGALSRFLKTSKDIDPRVAEGILSHFQMKPAEFKQSKRVPGAVEKAGNIGNVGVLTPFTASTVEQERQKRRQQQKEYR